MLPHDTFDQQLLANVRPPGWCNPKPEGRYNLVVIGAGTAGLISAVGAAGLGAKVAIVERQWMGGDCLNVGCVPSKAILRAARQCAAVRDAGRFGISVPSGVRIDFSAAMERMRRLRAGISASDSAARYRSLGVDVFFGEAHFTSNQTIEVDRQELQFSKAIIATGARAAIPPIPGLAQAGALTNETVFALTELPPRLAVIGAGPIGCELSQAFARFGSKVWLLSRTPRILPKEGPQAADIVERSLRRDGIEIRLDCQISSVGTTGNRKTLSFTQAGQSGQVEADAILIGVGRAPNVEGLKLEAAGVQYDEREGVKVDDHLRTTNRRIFAAGDICSHYKFTHVADATARIAIQNALFLGRAKASALTIPWCTYTDPEVAHVGLYPAEAASRGLELDTYEQSLDHVDRAVLDGETDGFVKVHVRRGTDQIVGATIVAAHAGEMISELGLAMAGKLGLRTIAKTIHPYPTQAEAIKRAADAYNRTRLTPRVKALLAQWMAWTR